MKPILEIKNVSKKFRIQGAAQPYLSLRENLFSFLKPASKKEEFWALKDVSFNVEPGDTIGIIGKNGAGKSTLLKILSKITPPTGGSIISRGRIASLLEVGTGFHPELSGRENIFMNGSILGMRRAEIIKNFDAIVDFAGVEKFLDTPLKHYSSGMQLRLAFAVSAFLENEILIIDEVLAVGDAEFQKKCMGKMEDVSKSGRTILFVSHNLTYVEEICSKTIYLNKGVVESFDATHIIVNDYLKRFRSLSQSGEKIETDAVRLKQVYLVDEKGAEKEKIKLSEAFGVKIKYEVLNDEHKVVPNIDVWSLRDDYIISSWPTIDVPKKKGEQEIVMWLPGNLLNTSTYAIGVGFTSVNFTPQVLHGYIKNYLVFDIEEDFESPSRLHFKGNFGSLLRPLLKWEFVNEGR